jgi:D-lactate dehydrogenase
MAQNSIEQQLLEILPAERVKCALIDRLSYASDAGFYQLIPQAMVLPQTEAEIQQLFLLSRRIKVPIVFRAGGTSLSGQCITDGILVDISRDWRKVQVNAAAGTVQVQPGITGGMVNHYLKKYQQKIGPDPASIHAAMMGGILSNNASGMCCGVAHNSYHTVKALRFMLPNGSLYDTRVADDYTRFEKEQTHLAATITQLSERVKQNTALSERIRYKYQTKNTVGYSLNALIDYQHPLDIFSHLLIGAEGTLAFIAEAEMLTLPDKACKATAMLYFPTMYEACAAIVPLKHTGVEALELMDRASLRSVEHLPGLPSFFASLPDGAAALLCEYQTVAPAELEEKIQVATEVLHSLPLLHPATFSTVEKERAFYWKLRKGLFPSVGAVRQRGTTVILEDIAVPVHKLADAVVDLQQLFVAYGYSNAIIFGHAKDGNIHFVITQLLDTPAEINRYDTFMKKVVELVVNKYDGALKAEHGTGRNMAPFIATEWGDEAYAIMQALKAAADSENLLNPGVIINASETAHIENLKDLPQVEEEVDKCIECGFCEVSCPSRDLTMTPRRRIVARRALQRIRKLGATSLEKELLNQYQYEGLDTCATDGLCATDCPVDINTGELVKRLRKEQHGKLSKWMAGALARHYATVEHMVRWLIAGVSWIDRLGSMHVVTNITRQFRKLIPSFPVFMPGVKAARSLPFTTPEEPHVVYFTSCINRVMEGHPAPGKSLQQTMLSLCEKAGVRVLLPPAIAGYCCGQPFSSKGFFEAGQQLLIQTIDALLAWSNNGAVPIVCDFSSCTYTFLQNAKQLPAIEKEKFNRLNIMDSVAYIEKHLLPKLTISSKSELAVLHPTCAVTKLQLHESLKNIAQQCSVTTVVPAYVGCCGMAGDRGFLVPELTAAATHLEVAEVKMYDTNTCYASAVTCEMALSHYSGKQFQHIAYLVDKHSEG